ncbi:PREDICTED: deleted in malignant brain tumors 1 protein-like, partial [Amphimedon queenslandica]|uniref:SRCR domain-containing protein n=1 Tax=Amphimedon queenslandica TaxID=400682 RepID=A0AAN0JV03_AMPQE
FQLRNTSLLLNQLVVLGQLNDNCQHGTLRLVNGSATYRGRLEICINNVWGSVCGNYYFQYYGTYNARVACRQLGYEVDGGQSVSYYGGAHYGQSTGPIWLNRLRCTGSENNLLDCNKAVDIGNTYDCSHSEDVSIVCPACSTGLVRLTDGLIPTEGTVEVCNHGAWTSVCDNGWGYQEAFVVCRQLGLPATDAQPVHYYNSFGYGHGIPTLNNWRCIGNESSLNDCLKSTSSCYYSYYSVRMYSISGVSCKGNIVPGNCSTGSMRLVGPNGPNKVEGRVEYCSNGVWSTVDSYGFDVRDAHVVCRRLGHQTPRALIFWNAYFGQGSGPDVAPEKRIRFSCSGNENSLIHCHNYASNSYCGKAIGFTCSSVVNCSNGTIHLTDGEGDNEGRVEICTDGIWMTIDARYWNYNNAKVVCRQLGYYDTWSVAITDTSWSGKNERVGYRYVCTGTENKLSKCSKNSPSLYYANSWFNQKRGGVTCQYNVTENYCDKEGSIRLSNGGDSREGRVEICLNGYWGTVCSTGWDERDALVACTQVGHHTLRAIPVTNEYFGRGTGPVHMTGVDCTGNEESLTQCSYVNGIGATNCYHAKDVGVMCIESPIHYSVTIDTDTDAISIGNRVVLTCNVSPAPPVDNAQPVYYYNSFGYGHGIPTLYNWRCIGNESSLNVCLNSTTTSCYYSYGGLYRISGVRCKGSIVPGI